MSKYINNPAPSTLPIESMEVGYTKSLLRYGIATDADISGVVFWAKNVTDNGAEQKTVLPYDINARSFLIESLDVGKEYSLQGAFLDQFAESNPALIDTKDPEILSIFNVPNYTTKVPAYLTNVAVLASDLGQIGSPTNNIALHTAGEATEMLVEIIPAAGLTGTDASAYDWSEATVLYRGVVNAEDVITLSAPSYAFVMRATSKHVFSNGVVDQAPATYYGDATNPVKAEDATAQPSTPSNLDITAIKVTGNVETYDMVVSWDWAALAGSGARRNALVSYRPVGTSEWKTETAVGDTHTFVGVPYRKTLEVKVVIKGWNENESSPATGTVFISERASDSAEAGYLVPVPDTSIPVSTNIQITDAGIRAFNNWDGTAGTATFFLDASNGNLTVGTTDEYNGVAPLTFDASTGILSIKGQTITDEIVAADYVMGWLDGSTPTFRTANRTADNGYSESTAGIWMGYEDDSTFKFSLGDGAQNITWDGNTLRISGDVVIGDTGNRTIDQAQLYVQLYRRSATKPVTPTTGSFDSPVPTGWSRTIPDYDGTPCWMTSRTFTSDGEYPQTDWEEPSKIAEAIDVARLVTLSADQQIIKIDSNGNPDVTEVTITPSVQNIENPQYQWSFSGGTGTIAGDNGSVTIPYGGFSTGSQAIVVTVLVPTAEGDRTDSITIVKVQDGGAGDSTFSAYLTNESHTLAANTDGSVPSYSGASGQAKVFYGAADITSECSFSVGVESAGLTVSIDSAGNYQVNSLIQDSGTAPIIINHPTYGTLQKVFSVAKAKTGIQGVKGDDSYFHVAYADNAAGTDNFNFTAGKYMGTYVSTSSTSSTNPSAYTWVRVKGYDALLFEDNTTTTINTGGTTTYSFTSEYEGPAILSFQGYDFENGVFLEVNGVSLTPKPLGSDQETKWYNYEIEVVEGTNTIVFDSPASDGAVVYKLLVSLGNRGIPGIDGDNGETSYLHIAYADSADGTLNFNQTSGLYIGQYVDFAELDSSNPADYTWSRMKGSDGLGTVTWNLLGGAELLEGSAIRGGNNNDWGSAAISNQRFDTAVIQATLSLTSKVMVGFVDSDTDQANWTDMQFAILMRSNGEIEIYEDAGRKFTLSGSYPANTTTGVRLRDEVVEYIVNGNVVYTSTKVPDSTYKAKISFSRINDIASSIAVSPIGLSGKDANPNLIDPNLHWVIGTSGTQGIYSKNGSHGENEIIQDRGPTGHAEAVWVGKSGNNSSDGGWNTEAIPVSQAYSYRFSVWMKQENGKGNTCYLGTNPEVLSVPEGNLNTNPYFWSGDFQETDKWYLVVGIVHAADYTGDVTGISGVYDPVTGRRVSEGLEYKHAPGITALTHRAYRHYALEATDIVKFARPRMEKLDGSEASLAALLGTQPIVDARGQGTFYLEYTGTWSSTINDAIAAAATAVVTNGTPRLDDVVVVARAGDSTTNPYHIRYIGGDPTIATSWDKISMVIHGDALIEGTVLADRVVANMEINAPLITGGRIEVGGGSKVILDGSNVDSPIEVLDPDGGLVLGWEDDTFRFRGRLGTGKIDNMSVFSQYIQNIIAPPMAESHGGTFSAPRDVAFKEPSASTQTEAFNANDHDVVVSCSVRMVGQGIDSTTPVTATYYLDRSVNGGSWVNLYSEELLALPSREVGNPEYYKTHELVYTDEVPTASEGDTLAYRFRAVHGTGLGTEYSLVIDDATVAQQVTGGSVAGTATSATFPYVGLDQVGSSSYPRMTLRNHEGTSNSWVRLPTANGGLLPYSNRVSNIGSPAWRFSQIHSVQFFEDGVYLEDKYLGITAAAYDATRLGGIHAKEYSKFDDYKSANVTSGWVTIAECPGGRGYGEIYVWDTGSSDHNILRLSVFRSYADDGINVISYGGHGADLSAVRWIRESDNTYGNKKLQVYLTDTVDLKVAIKDSEYLQSYNRLNIVTPTLEGMPTGYMPSVRADQVDLGAGGSSGSTGDIFVKSNRVLHEGDLANLNDAETLGGLAPAQLLRSDTSDTMAGQLTIVNAPTIGGNPDNIVSNAALVVTGGGSSFLGLDSNEISSTTALTVSTPEMLVQSPITIQGGPKLIGLSDGTLRNINSRGYIDIGAKTDSYLHIYTDLPEIYFNKQLRILGGRVWHSGNDGSGSGLDADTVDGLDSTDFVLAKTITTPLIKGEYKRVLRASGVALSSSIRVVFHGTTGNVVISTIADITVNHSGDIKISSQTSAYSPLYLKVVSDGNNNYDLYVKYDSGSGTSMPLKAQVINYSRAEIIPEPTDTEYTVTTLEHYAKPNTVKHSQVSGDIDVITDGDFYADTDKVVWHAGNDGAGSGLDADLLDGLQSYQFARTDVGEEFNNPYVTFSNSTRVNAYGGLTVNTEDGFRLLRRYGSGTGDDVVDISMGDSDLTFTIDNTNDAALGTFIFKNLSETGSSRNVLVVNHTSFTHMGHTVWHSGNDGAGSGMDADRVDGLEASQLLRSDTNDTMNGKLTISSSGTIGASTAGIGNGYLQITDGTQTLAFDANEIACTTELVITADNLTMNGNDVWHEGNDGPGSGLNADLLDSLESVQFARADAAGTLGGYDAYQYWYKSYSVNATTIEPLTLDDGSPLPTGGTYKFSAHISETGTNNASVAVFWYVDDHWEVHETATSGSFSNHIEFVVDNGVPAIKTYHPNLYAVNVYHERYNLGEGTGPDNTRYLAGMDGILGYTDGVLWLKGTDRVWHSGNDGSGSGLDADKVDGIEGSSLARTDTDEQFFGTVDFYGLVDINTGLRTNGQTILNGSDTWLRTHGGTGWYNATYDGGINMTDTTWVRVYGDKQFYVSNNHSTAAIMAQGGITSNSRFFVNNPTGEGGLVGSYKTTGAGTDQIIWTIGTDWATHSSHFGIGYHHGPEVVGGNEHQIVYKSNGVTNVRISLLGNAWFSKSVNSPIIKENGINIADKYLNVNSLNYGSPETWAAAWTAVEEFKDWVSSGDADTSGYATVTDSIATGFINSIIGNFNTVVADSANIGYITARAIEVTGRQKLVNNFSASGHLDGWFSSGSDHHFTSAANFNYIDESLISNILTVNSDAVQTLRIPASGNQAYGHAPAEVDHNAIYKVSVMLYVGGPTEDGLRYVGIKASTTKDQVDAPGGLPLEEYRATDRVLLNAENTNAYILSASSAWATRIYVTGYVVGANRSVDEVPETNRPIFKMSPDTKYLWLRILNWANDSTETIMHIYNPSISEVNTGKIVAHNITANAITAQHLSADSVTAGAIQSATINAGHIQSGAVTTVKLAADAVTADKIAANTITASEIAANAITASELAANSVNADHIVANSITASELDAGSVNASHIVSGSVTTTKLAADAVTADKIAANTITASEIAANAITASELAANSVNATHIVAGSITAAEIAANAITASELAANSVNATHIVANSITAAEIAANAITASELAANSVNATHIVANSITAAEIAANVITAAEIAADAITTSELAADSVNATHIVAGSITAAEIAANAITASELAANSVNAGHIVAGSITAAEIAAGSIEAYNIAVEALELVNNYSSSNRGTEGWSGNFPLVEEVQLEGQTVKTHKVTTSGNVQVHSSRFEIDHNAIYECCLSIYSDHPDGAGTRYFGMHSYDSNSSGLTHDYFDEETRDLLSATSNFYWWSGDVYGGNWKHFRCYLIGANVDPKDVPKTDFRIVRLRHNATMACLRYLNYYNGGVSVTNHFYNPSVRKVGSGKISATQIEAGSISGDKITAGTVNGDRIIANTMQGDRITAGTLHGNRIVANSITASEIATDAITSSEISAGAITSTKIATGAITAAKIAAGTITSSEISAGAITSTKIATGAITATKIATGTITATQVATGTLTANEIDVSTIAIDDLSWAYGSFGTTSTDIDGTIYGTYFRVSSPNTGWDNTAAVGITVDGQDDVGLVIKHSYDVASTSPTGRGLHIETTNAVGAMINSSRSTGLSVVGGTAVGSGALNVYTNSYADNALVVGIGKTLLSTTKIGGSIESRFLNDPMLSVSRPSTSANQTVPTLEVTHTGWLTGEDEAPAIVATGKSTFKGVVEVLPESANPDSSTEAAMELVAENGHKARHFWRSSDNNYGIYMADPSGNYDTRVRWAGNTGNWGFYNSTYTAINTNYGYIRIGPRSSSFGHFYTDRGGFYFNKQLYVAGDVTFFYSDERLKTVHSALDSAQALESILSWKPVRYTGNLVAKENGFDSEGVQIGLLAQDIERSYPELTPLAPFDDAGDGVSKSGQEYKTLKYERTTAVLVSALQEETKQRKKLEERLARMEAMLEQLLEDK